MEMHLNEDFTQRSRLEDVGRWYVSRFVQNVGALLPPGARVFDAGAGECAYKPFFTGTRYVAADLAVGEETWNYRNLDLITSLDSLPVVDFMFDAVLCTQVLEHLPNPAECVCELFRILKPGGKLYLTAPMSHREHQVPYDFFRYTSFGLRSICSAAGFSQMEIRPFGGICVRWAYEAPRFLELLPRSGLRGGRPSVSGLLAFPLRLVLVPAIRLLQMLLLYADRFDQTKDDPFGWSVVATK